MSSMPFCAARRLTIPASGTPRCAGSGAPREELSFELRLHGEALRVVVSGR